MLQNQYDIIKLALGRFLHYLVKLQMQISCRYSAHTKEYANKLYFLPLPLLFIHEF